MNPGGFNCHLDASGYIWIDPGTPGYIWTDPGTPGYIWIHLVTSGYIWIHLDTSGPIVKGKPIHTCIHTLTEASTMYALSLTLSPDCGSGGLSLSLSLSGLVV